MYLVLYFATLLKKKKVYKKLIKSYRKYEIAVSNRGVKPSSPANLLDEVLRKQHRKFSKLQAGYQRD